MSSQRQLTRQRLIDAALELFASQGVTETTTKQIAELAAVNEVTLFRQFGSKHGLLLAVIEEAAVFTHLGQTLVEQAGQTDNIYQVLQDYTSACLQALEAVPEVVRSVVGEAGQYPAENREALGRGFTQANRYVAEYFATVIDRGQLKTYLPAEKLASLLHGMLLGYAVIEFTSEFHQLWQDRDDFLETLVTLFLHGAVSQSDSHSLPRLSASDSQYSSSNSGSYLVLHSSSSSLNNTNSNHFEVTIAETTADKVADLPANLVHLLLQQAKKLSVQDYAIAYVLFGAGLSAAELIRLERSHYIRDAQHQILQIEPNRQVPLNQWILGKRYGSYTKNPLTQWLKSRKDYQAALFMNDMGEPLSEIELRQRWHAIAEGLLTPDGHLPTLRQAQQTWCVEMLMRGMSLEDLQILTGWDAAKLQPFAHRAKEKAALEHAIRLDQKS